MSSGASHRSSEDGTPRRLVTLVGTLLAFESSLYSVLTPILPHYERTLGASKPAIGVLAGAYTGGLIPGSILAGWMATRVGVRRTTFAGLTAFALTVGAFGFGRSIVVLDLLRALQGVACGFIWGGALTWVLAASPASRRGAVFGSAFGAAILGTLLGPAIGTVAVSFGTEIMFGALGVIALGLAGWVRSYPELALAASDRLARPAGLMRNRAVLLGAWIVLLEAVAAGVVYTLIPLRLSRFGASTLAIGATFLVASALSVAVATQTGRLTDRHGAIAPVAVGLAFAAAMMAVLPLPHSAAVLALVTVIAMAGPLTVFIVPASALLTVAVEHAGITLAVGIMVFNLAFALGQTIGAPAGAVLAQATTDAVPFVVVAAVLLLTLGVLLLWRRQPQVAQAAFAAELPASSPPSAAQGDGRSAAPTPSPAEAIHHLQQLDAR
ncbi:MAG TPA: MFS transporter [Solirubrobacteraceae bacterium]